MEKIVNVWDTYVKRPNGTLMHFDIIVPVDVKETDRVYEYGRQYLKTKGVNVPSLSTKECRLCHIEQLRPDWEAKILEQGYFIIELDGCD